jgi:DNA-binding XRE family transcriptional regulator
VCLPQRPVLGYFASSALVCQLHAGVGDAATPRGHSAGSGKALRRTIRRSAREGGSGCDFSLSRRRNHLASGRFRRRRLPTVLAVSGSMVQDRKSPTGSGQSKILELRSQRQADATNPSEWTQAGLAQKVGASVRSVKAWEAGDTLPRLFYRRRLAKALEVSVSDLGF